MFVNSNAKYYNAFNLINGIGPITFKKLLAHFKSLKEAWTANLSQLKEAGLEKSAIEQIRISRQKIDPDSEAKKLEKEDIDLITIEDENYPKLLKEIYNPPALLYVRGKFEKKDEFSLGVVGTRKLSLYGQQITPQITADLAKAGLTIVSGLAKGIDALAHEAALKGGGRTIAVLGSGVDRKSVYPTSNGYLAEKIISQNGVVLSEFPLGAIGQPSHFPQRNRIISGLSLGILVIEAPERSGALITARDALEQHREVFAVPGPVFSKNSLGPNNLIKMGAKLVTEANDILEELNLSLLTSIQKNREILPDSKEEGLILEALSSEPLHIDKIIIQAKLPAHIINSTLTLMEMKGKVRNLGGNNYVLAY